MLSTVKAVSNKRVEETYATVDNYVRLGSLVSSTFEKFVVALYVFVNRTISQLVLDMAYSTNWLSFRYPLTPTFCDSVKSVESQ